MQRFMSQLPARYQRFFRYAFVGVSTFAVDLAFLYLLIDAFSVHYLVATPIAFWIGASLNYFISRHYVFAGTKRGLRDGYFFFLKFALIGAAVTAILIWILVQFVDWPIVYMRTAVAGSVGAANYLANLFINFQVAGRELQ